MGTGVLGSVGPRSTSRETLMSRKSILRAALLLIVIAAVASSAARVAASWHSGTQDVASWVSGVEGS